jgi:cation-transporting ATPase 13A2
VSNKVVKLQYFVNYSLKSSLIFINSFGLDFPIYKSTGLVKFQPYRLETKTPHRSFTLQAHLHHTARATHETKYSYQSRKMVLFDSEQLVNRAIDNGYLPSTIIRYGIRAQLADRLRNISTTSLTQAYETKMKYVEALRSRPIAIETGKANEQHYEVGTGVLKACLGTRMKYSCCLYGSNEKIDTTETLDAAEDKMLEEYVTRAELVDGQNVLDLGCGWGSASLYFAEKFPGSKITAFSNSRTQREYIEGKANEKKLSNLRVVTGDVVEHEFEEGMYDRVVSIELFEHMKNYELLLAKVSRALKPGGKLFVHIFAHKTTPYDFETGWMTEHFFTGGTMPSADLLLYFQRDLTLKQQWWVNGRHYAKTCEDWLSKMNASKKEIWPHLEETYGNQEATKWFYRWQVFYMACAELFAYEGGDTWGVSHYLFEKTVKQ